MSRRGGADYNSESYDDFLMKKIEVNIQKINTHSK